MAFYFAWVEANQTTFSSAFEREDEEVLSFEIRHNEGDFASLRLDVRNPRVGLLAIGRNRWGWLSDDNGPLFFGRLIGLPQEMRADVVSLSFIAKPLNYQTAKTALAATMKQTEFYDPLFIDSERLIEPDTVLESRPEVWCIDRVTHQLTSSNVVVGEAGTISFGGDAFYDSVSCGYSSAPQRKVVIEASVTWNQYAFGSISLPFREIKTYTGDGLLADWPKTGASIGSGWSVKNGFAQDVFLDINTETISDENGGSYSLYRWTITGQVDFNYEVSRQYTEVARFTLASDVQEIVTEEGDEDVISTSVSGEADAPIDAGGLMPIRDLKRRAYFTTARGKQSVAYLGNIAAARLWASARCVDVSFTVPFSYAANLSLRHNGSIEDPRLPGGIATGKIKEYTIFCDGDTGQLGCTVTLGCTPGYGGTLTTTPGSPVYVADGYATGYQAVVGGSSTLVVDGSGDPAVLIDDYDDTEIQDDGLSLDNMNARTCVLSTTIINPASDQLQHIFFSQTDTNTALTENPTQVAVDLKPLTGGPFETPYNITCSTLVVPKTIDLEAA